VRSVNVDMGLLERPELTLTPGCYPDHTELELAFSF